MVMRFEIKHKDHEDSIIKDMLDIYREAEKILVGSSALTKLTVRAYGRTLERLRDKNPTVN